MSLLILAVSKNNKNFALKAKRELVFPITSSQVIKILSMQYMSKRSYVIRAIILHLEKTNLLSKKGTVAT